MPATDNLFKNENDDKTNGLSSDRDIFEPNMIRLALVLPVFLFLLRKEAVCLNQSVLKKDIQKEWLVYEGNKYIPYEQSDRAVHTIYFFLNPLTFKGDYLQIESESRFSLFINRQLFLENSSSKRIYLDSLPQTGRILIGLYVQGEVSNQSLSTRIYSDIIKHADTREDIPQKRKSSYFRDFVIIATIFLFVFLILMIQLNPQLSSDYFSVNKIFSIRETDDDQFYLRITSANILFYTFTSLVLGLFVFVAGESASHEINSIVHPTSTFGDSLRVWMKTSLIILSVLFLKIVLVFVTAFLFDSKETAGYHFFNFIRVVLVITTILTLILIGYYMIHGSNEGFYTFLSESLRWAIGSWIIILFFKLSNRVRFSPIHLFSYICATEILPFLIIVKILYE